MPTFKVYDSAADTWLEITGAKGDKGDKGDTGNTGAKGDPGTAATLSIGTVTTGAPGTNASVTEGGTPQARTFDLTIPRGATGTTGAKGDKGDKGDTGATGTAATITSASATTGAAGSNASVTLGGTASARTFSFTVPRGDTGAKGDTGDVGPNPLHVGSTPPSNPAVQRLWFDPNG